MERDPTTGLGDATALTQGSLLGSGPSGTSAVAARWIRTLAARRPRLSPRVALAISLPVFVVATVLAVRGLPELERDPRWWLLGVTAAATLLGTLVNAIEYRFIGRLVSARIEMTRSLRVAVVATAANVFPVPGAVLVRVADLRKSGVGFGPAGHALATSGLGLMATAFSLAGLFQVAVGPRRAIGLGALVLGLLLFGLVLAMLASGGRRSPFLNLGLLVVIQSSSVATKALALGSCAWFLGFEMSVSEALAVGLANVVALAVGIFPGGLGITEVLAAAISPVVGVAPSIGLLSNAILRVVGLVVSGLLALGVLVFGGKSQFTSPAHSDELHEFTPGGSP